MESLHLSSEKVSISIFFQAFLLLFMCVLFYMMTSGKPSWVQKGWGGRGKLNEDYCKPKGLQSLENVFLARARILPVWTAPSPSKVLPCPGRGRGGRWGRRWLFCPRAAATQPPDSGWLSASSCPEIQSWQTLLSNWSRSLEIQCSDWWHFY